MAAKSSQLSHLRSKPPAMNRLHSAMNHQPKQNETLSLKWPRGWPGRRALSEQGGPLVLSVSSVVECSARRNSSQIKYKPANPAESNTSAQLILSSLSTERKVQKFQIHAKNRPCQKNTVS
jgi:hypothetical protein